MSKLDEAIEAGWKAAVRYDDTPDGLMQFMPANERECVKRTILAALPILLGEPVAWAVRDHSDGKLWTFDASKRAAERIADNADDTLVALYAPSLGEGG